MKNEGPNISIANNSVLVLAAMNGTDFLIPDCFALQKFFKFKSSLGNFLLVL